MKQHNYLVSGESVPVLLTVEEAGTLLRIGRTKAYAMAREWRETDGRSGLPVIDLGHVLRVPRQALEDLIGADLSTVISDRDGKPRKASRKRNRQIGIAGQRDLFETVDD